MTQVPDNGCTEDPETNEDDPSDMPRWVKLSGIVALLLVVAVIAMLLTGHGAGRHMGQGGGLDDIWR